MYWTEFKKIATLALTVFLLSSCAENAEKAEEQVKAEAKQETAITKEQQIARLVENELNIPATEEYDIQILYKNIDADTLEDALVLVNRKEAGFQNAKLNDREHFFANTGYTGLFNYVFVWLGNSKSLLKTTPVGSNVNYALRAEFLELTSKAHTDFYVEYRVKNSLYRNYYTVRGKEIFLTLLNIVTAFGMSYKDLLMEKIEERIKFKDFEDILTEFEEMKNELLDNSVKHINTHVEEIIKQSENIKQANNKLLKSAELIFETHLNTVRNKLNDFRINKIVNKIKEL